jgi:hypothetical protein
MTEQDARIEVADLDWPGQVRALADGELDDAAAAAVRKRAGADPDDRARLDAQVRNEQRLRERVGAVGRSAVPAAPDDLRYRVRAALAAAPSDGEDDAGGRRSWLIGAGRPSVWAVAATLAVITGAVLFGILGRPIDSFQSGGGADPVAETGVFVSSEHMRCAGHAPTRRDKTTWTDRAAAEEALSGHLGAPVPIIDLEAFGYRFVGAGPCAMPGPMASGHLMFARGEPAEDGCPEAMLSLFVVRDVGQFETAVDAHLAPWHWLRAAEPPLCTKRVAVATDGTLFYFLVCCNESRLTALADTIARAARVP